MTRVVVLGSTGSIGRATLSVIARHADRFQVVAVCAHSSVDEVAAQVIEHNVPVAVIADSEILDGVTDLPKADWRSGQSAVLDLVADENVDVVVNAIVGSAGLEATLAALGAGKRLALANKESLVAGGPLVVEAARAGGGELIPIDSEHSAILQCLAGHDPESVARLVLTASGGPFRGLERRELERVGPEGGGLPVLGADHAREAGRRRAEDRLLQWPDGLWGVRALCVGAAPETPIG